MRDLSQRHAGTCGFIRFIHLPRCRRGLRRTSVSILDNQFDTLLNPTLLIEVLSPSTEAYDRGRKFEKYQTIESLREYLLVASDRVHADLFTRQADGRWLLTSATRLEDSLELESVGCSLTLASLYEKVDLGESASTTPQA